MAAEQITPTSYINHHLSFFQKPLGDGGFWTLHMDSLVVSVILGIIGIGLFWLVARGATAGVPGKRQAFVELAFEFIDEQVKGIFHGDRHKFIAPAAFTVFFWVLLMNAMDFLPVDIIALGTHHISEHGFRIVPTADVNTTFALALSVWLMMIYYSIKVKGLGGWIMNCSARPSAPTPCSGPRTSCSTWSSTSPSRFRIPCGFTETCMRGRSSSCCCGCGPRPGWSVRYSAACWAWDGQFSTS